MFLPMHLQDQIYQKCEKSGVFLHKLGIRPILIDPNSFYCKKRDEMDWIFYFNFTTWQRHYYHENVMKMDWIFYFVCW